jgi:RNA polymerase sigma factor (sigma-70 family)
MTPESLIAPARLARRPVLATQTDSRLVDLVRAGDEPAFETIVSRYRAALLRYAERFLSRERAEDAVQQSFVSAYEAMLRDDAALNLRPWLYRIAHNTSLNALRDRGLRHAQLDEGIDGVERPDQALERRQGLRELLTAVQALPDRQRDAIVLRELEGRSYEEIASQLGVSDGSVRQLLNRARNTLRAGATAVVPVGLLLRLPWAAQAEPIAARVAELGAGAGAGAVMAKLCATALVTGAVVGGVAVAPEVGKEERADGPDKAEASESSDEGESANGLGAGKPASSGPNGGGTSGDDRRDEEGEGDRGRGDDDRRDHREGRDDRDDDDRSGRGEGGNDVRAEDDERVSEREDEHEAGERSGRRRSGGGDEESSGPGSADDADRGGSDGSSGSGSGSGSGGGSGSGSGSGNGSGSGSGSGESGSGPEPDESEPEPDSGSGEAEPTDEAQFDD